MRQRTAAVTRSPRPPAQRLGVEAAGILPPKQAVLRIEARRSRIRRARLLAISRTGHDQPMHVFQRSAAPLKLTGKPVQQFRMRRRRTAEPEVARCRDDSLAEMMVPQAVY
jgi:hypothetical protein